MFIRPTPRPVLKRRTGIGTILQPLIDGLIIIGVCWVFAQKNVGYLTQDYIIFILILLGLVSVMYDRYAIYRSSIVYTDKVLSIFNAWTITFLAIIVLGFLTRQSAVYSRIFVVETYIWGFLLQCFAHGVIRKLNRKLNEQSDAVDNVIIVGHGPLASYLQHKVSSNPWLHQWVVGTVSIEEEQLDPSGKVTQESGNDDVIKLGQVDELPALVDEHNINTIYIVTPLESSKVLETLYFDLLDKHVSIHWVPDIFSLRLINHSVREIAGIPVLTLSETPLTGVSKLAKAIEDRVLAFLILVLVSPLLAIIAIAIKLDSPGPIFFRQNRTGWNGMAFRIWKFRSMRVETQDAVDKKELKQAEKDDPRLTKIGKFIRKTSLDELPQLLNVLAGDMSLVGPRPHAIQHDEVYAKRITDYYVRNNIKPGMTGLAQVRGYRGETKEIDQMMKRIESDIEYINNWSISLDLSIILRTVTAFSGKSAY